MGGHGRKLSSRGDSGDSDLERFRENILDHPDEADAISGSNLDNSSSTGPIKVVVKQDGIGRTGGIIVACFAGLALGLSVMAVVLMLLRDRDRADAENRRHAEVMEQMRKTETEARMVQYYLQDPSFRTEAELKEWARYKHAQENQK